MITLGEIAKRAGVSRTAVSFVLSGGPYSKKVSVHTRENILTIARELNYIPNQVARSLRNRRTGIVGNVAREKRHDGSIAHRNPSTMRAVKTRK